jgi:hypothetical protein
MIWDVHPGYRGQKAPDAGSGVLKTPLVLVNIPHLLFEVNPQTIKAVK